MPHPALPPSWCGLPHVFLTAPRLPPFPAQSSTSVWPCLPASARCSLGSQGGGRAAGPCLATAVPLGSWPQPQVPVPTGVSLGVDIPDQDSASVRSSQHTGISKNQISERSWCLSCRLPPESNQTVLCSSSFPPTVTFCQL